MATGVTGPNLGAGLHKMAKVIEGASVATVTESAKSASDIHYAQILKDSGGDGALSGVGAAKGRGGNAKVGSRIKVDKSKTKPSALIAAKGPLHIINNDTSGHVIRSAYAGGARRKGFIGPTFAGQFGARNVMGPSKRAVINIPGVGFRASARHPGTKGKKTWQAGAKKAAPVIRKTMSGRTRNVVKGAMKI